MREGRSQMRALLDEMAFEGDPQAYLEELTANPKWRAETPEGIADVFQRYIDRMAPKVEEVFRFKPKAAYGVRPLAPELTGSMTFGYYSMPSPHQPDGRYLFNADNLSQAPLLNIGALNYPELVPGPHFHIAYSSEARLVGHDCFIPFRSRWSPYP